MLDFSRLTVYTVLRKGNKPIQTNMITTQPEIKQTLVGFFRSEMKRHKANMSGKLSKKELKHLVDNQIPY